jgi:hypothetical protein
MKEIQIIDIINTRNAILHEFGIRVYEAAKPYLEANQSILLSFEGLKNVTSGFCNASIGKLYLEYPDAIINLKGVEGHSIWNDKINDAIMLAKNPEIATIQNNAISDLLTS